MLSNPGLKFNGIRRNNASRYKNMSHLICLSALTAYFYTMSVTFTDSGGIYTFLNHGVTHRNNIITK